MSDPAGQAIDVRALMDRLDGDWMLLEELVSLYLDDEPVLMKQIARAIAAGDAEALRRSAHTLKGSVGNFCAPAAQAAALALESAGRDRALGQASALLEQLTIQLALVRTALHELVGSR